MAKATAKFIHSHSGMSQVILKGNAKLQSMQNSKMESVLRTIEAQFLQQFGVVGRFEVESFMTDRSSAKIQAADAQTGAVLKNNPKWLNQFVENMKL